tara:strand:- start:62 stop:244 length:183 start_codon:yes stop_codon:yes gene_type:complete
MGEIMGDHISTLINKLLIKAMMIKIQRQDFEIKQLQHNIQFFSVNTDTTAIGAVNAGEKK